jgi:hypothetical protein
MSRSIEQAEDLAGSMELIGDGDTPDKPTEEDKPDFEARVAQLESDNAKLKGQVDSEKETKQYWKEQYDGTQRRQTTSRLANDEGREDSEREEEEQEDLVEVLATGDRKKIKSAFRKLGFVSESEVNQQLETRWAQVETAAQVQARHPEITDVKSELHQETLKQIDSLKAQGVDIPNLLGIAADLAYANLTRQGRISKPTKREERGESDEDRLERIAEQQGQTGSRRRNPAEGRDNEGLTDSQRMIAKKFGISEKDYASRASRGVRIAGVPKG